MCKLSLRRIICGADDKKLAEVICHKEKFCNFVLGKHNFVELTLKIF